MFVADTCQCLIDGLNVDGAGKKEHSGAIQTLGADMPALEPARHVLDVFEARQPVPTPNLKGRQDMDTNRLRGVRLRVLEHNRPVDWELNPCAAVVDCDGGAITDRL